MVSGISIADPDAGAGSMLVTLSVPSGTLAAVSGGGVVVGGSGSGTLTLTGTVTDINTFLAAPSVTFTTAPNAAANVLLTVTTNDQGNTPAPAQTDTDAFTIVVTAVNDAPAGTDGSVTVNEDATYTFLATDFGFTDPNDAPANAFLAVRIASLPGAGTLFHTVNGPVGIGTVVSVADINAGLLRYTPPADANGAGFASFTFQVQDDGGVLNAGIDLDASPNTLTINVTAINDAPVNTVPGAQTVTENRNVAFSSLNGNAISIADLDSGGADVEVTLSSATGSLLLPDLTGLTLTGGANGTGTLTVRASVAMLNARLDGLTFTETLPGTGAASFTIVTNDLGNTGAPGALSDTDTVTVNVLAAPTIRSTGAIAVDGTVDAAWAAATSQALANQVDVDTLGGPGIASAADASATWSALWDNNYLYVLVTVTDDDIRLGDSVDPWNDDSVEIFVDGDYSQSGAYDGINDSQYIFRYNNAGVFVSPSSANLDTTGIDVAWSTPAANQYVMELRIPWAKFGGLTLVDGQPLGLDVHVNDDDNEPNVAPDPDDFREGKLAWSQVIDNASSDTRAFGLVRLQDAVPAGVADTYGTNEDTPLAVPAVTGVLVNDTGLGDGGITLAVMGVPVGGAVALNNDGSFTFTPAANFNGAASFVYRITDADGDTATATVTVNVTAVNDAPAGTDGSVTVNEDATYTFLATDFGFTDPNDAPANAFLAVHIASLPGAGTLFHTVNGPVGIGTVVSVADINAGFLRFTPLADQNGAPYITFTFQVQDDGGVLIGGVDLDPTPNTMTINVTAVNDAPVNTVPGAGAALEDVASVVSGISIADPDAGAGSMLVTLSVPSGTLAAVSGGGVVVGGSGSGTLTLTGTVTDINTFLAAPSVTFTTAPNAAANVLLTVTTNDQGNTPAPAQTDTDAFTIVVTAVNDAPAGTDGSVTVNEDATYTFLATDFGFTDPNDAPTNAFLAVRIASLPGAGTLFHTVNGPVGIGTVVSVADINAGLLRYTPPADANGAGFASFTFQVQDDGGVLNAGIDLDASPNTLTINVTAVNDAPVNTVPGAQTTPEDTALVFSAGTGNLVAIADVDAGAGLVDVTLTVTNGTLTLAGTAGLAFQAGANGTATMTVRGSIVDLNAAMDGMSYAPALNYNGAATLTITTDDRGNTPAPALNDTDVVNITVTAVNDAPVNTVPGAQTVNEDTSLAFAGANTISVADVDGNVTAVRLTVASGALNVTLQGAAAIGAGANGSADLTVTGTQADINATIATLTYQGILNFNGADTLTVRATDAGGLFDQDTVAITVNPVNDAPANVVPVAQVTPEDTALVFAGANAVSIGDVDAGAATVQAQLTVTNGTLTLSGIAGLTFVAGANGAATMTVQGTIADLNAALNGMSYLPTANYNGPATLTIVTDDLGNSPAPALSDTDVVNITVTPVNDAPVGSDDAYAVNEDAPLNVAAAGVLANDTDVDGPALSTVLVAGPANAAAFTLNADGSFNYTPIANFNGTDTFTYRASDGLLQSGVVTVTITVNPVNDAPVNTVPGAQTGNEDAALALAGVSVNDVDGGPVAVTLGVTSGMLNVSLAGGAAIGAGANGSATLTLTGTQAQVNAALATLAYTGASNWSGADTLTMTTTDLGNFGAGGPLGDVDTVALTINPVNDAPVIGNNTYTINAGGTLVIGGANLSATDIDDASGGLLFSVGSLTNGYFALVSNPTAPITSFTQAQVQAGQVQFVHSGFGVPAFTITVSDNAAAAGPYAANITVIGTGVGTPAPTPGGGGGGGGTTTVTPTDLPPVPTATPPAPATVGFTEFLRGGGAGSGDEGTGSVFAEETVVVPTQQGATRTERLVGPEALIPSVRMQTDTIETTSARAEIAVEPIRAEMRVLPTRHGLDLAEDDPERQQIEIVMNSVRLSGMALSVGAIWWAARAAGLVASLLASSPAWRHVDPLPVLGRDEEDEEEQWDEASAEDREKRDEEHRAAWVLEGRNSEA